VTEGRTTKPASETLVFNCEAIAEEVGLVGGRVKISGAKLGPDPVARRAWYLLAPRPSAEWHSGAMNLNPFRLFRQHQEAANVQWLASPTVVLELGGCDEPTTHSRTGAIRGCQPRAAPGEWLLGRASQKTLAKSLGRFADRRFCVEQIAALTALTLILHPN
jgi:hypothetical protein